MSVMTTQVADPYMQVHKYVFVANLGIVPIALRADFHCESTVKVAGDQYK